MIFRKKCQITGLTLAGYCAFSRDWNLAVSLAGAGTILTILGLMEEFLKNQVYAIKVVGEHALY